MRILYIGCVQSSYLLLKKLVELRANIIGVITKKESKINADFVDLVPLCEENGIDFKCVNNINDEESKQFIKMINPEIAFCFGWSQLIRKEVIQMIPEGIIGFHPAALPQNKGRHPIIWALVLGLTETASTFFLIDESADGGDIISQIPVKISYEDDAKTLYDKIMKVAEIQVEDIVKILDDSTLSLPVKVNKGGNVWRKRGKLDGEIDWRMSGYAIYNLVRGLTKPYVGAHFQHNGKEYKVWKVQELELKEGLENIEPGKVLAVYKDGSFDVKVYDEIIRILECDVINVSEGEYLQ